MNNIVYYCFLIVVIVFFAYINTSNNVESFTPKIREFYRPLFRNTRLIGEDVYNKTSSNILNLFRKFGIL